MVFEGVSMEESRGALIARQTINDILGQVAVETPISPYDFSIDQNERYLYVPDGDERRLVVFHATAEPAGDLALASQEERHSLGWRKCAVGAGLYGGNTPYAASASVVKSQQPREIHMYLTDPVEKTDIVAPRGAGYLGKMIRSQFDRRYAEQQAHQRTEESAPIELLEPGLVSAALRDVYVVSPQAQALKPRWIKVAAQPQVAGNQTLEYMGRAHQYQDIKRGLQTRAKFLATVGARIGSRALSGATSRG
jgi:hypothetical protein